MKPRSEGYQIDFLFRNAPPRPPVGPTFLGPTVEGLVQQACLQYSRNAVELHHTWKLHEDGIPLMEPATTMHSKAYTVTPEGPLHPDDLLLCDWKDQPMGDSAAEARKLRHDRARAGTTAPSSRTTTTTIRTKKDSRVLREEMQTWMKKTTYLSNDYSRKVHDFKSLAQTNQELAVELEAKRKLLQEERQKAAREQFDAPPDAWKHPHRPDLKPKAILPLLPHVDYWGMPFTHTVLDKGPPNLGRCLMTDIQQAEVHHKFTTQIYVPGEASQDKPYKAVQAYDLDVVPLQEEDEAPTHFCWFVDQDAVHYLPIVSRVRLATGRPAKGSFRRVDRRETTEAERTEQEERAAEVDADLQEKHHVAVEKVAATAAAAATTTTTTVTEPSKVDENDDGEDDFGDDDSSDDEHIFGGGTKTIVAEG